MSVTVDVGESTVTLIDFPQMISTKHPNAHFYFERDLKGLVKFFTMKLKYEISPEDVADILSLDNALRGDDEATPARLDVATKASGYDGTQPDKRRGKGKYEDGEDDEDEAGDPEADEDETED